MCVLHPRWQIFSCRRLIDRLCWSLLTFLQVTFAHGAFQIWDIIRKRVVAPFKQHQHLVWSLDVSPNGRLLVTGSYDYSVRIWKMRDGSSKRLVSTISQNYTSVRCSPNGRYVAASNDDGFLRIWDARSCHLIGRWKGHDETRSLASSPDGETLVSSGRDPRVKCWDAGSLKVTAQSGSSVVQPVLAEKKRNPEFDRQSVSYILLLTLLSWPSS